MVKGNHTTAARKMFKYIVLSVMNLVALFKKIVNY
jgi:hypothetical protein